MIQIIRGDDTQIDFEIKDNDGNVVDLTDTRIFFTIKEFADELDEEALYKNDFDYPGDGSDGVINLQIPNEDTRGFEVGVYSYDLQIKYPDGAISSTEVGRLKVERDLTIRDE